MQLAFVRFVGFLLGPPLGCLFEKGAHARGCWPAKTAEVVRLLLLLWLLGRGLGGALLCRGKPLEASVFSSLLGGAVAWLSCWLRLLLF